ncbi:MAG: cohesin domain-containing protein [Candidatus Shapirobacteria bacterium]
MNRGSKLLVLVLVGMMMVAGNVKAAWAGPKLTLTPTTKEVSINDTFSVVVGVASGTEKVLGIDLWMVFDASKLEITSVDAVSSPAFPFTMGDKNIDNVKGTLMLPLMPQSSSGLAAEVANGGLVTVNFKAKANGTASFSFTCESGSMSDTNILKPDVTDVVDCTANDSGLYTIKVASSGGDDGGSTAAATATPVPTSSTTLPQTGAVENTIILLVGAVLAMILGVTVIKL